MEEKDFISKKYTSHIKNGSVSAEAPSNIALVKYWGKYGEQLPANPSLSFTLTQCKTLTTLKFERKTTSENKFDFEVFFENKRNPAFEPKIKQFFERIFPYVPFLKDYKFTLKTENTFPHSSGIASSASGMAALALCLVEMEKKMKEDSSHSFGMKEKQFYNQKASFLARLGSGSACRSIYRGLVVWGKHREIQGSSDLFGTKYPYEIHKNFNNYQDVILLVDEGEKQVSSSMGHNLMNGHPFAEARFRQAHENLSNLIEILRTGDLNGFVQIVETEALSLHAMMMTATPGFMLMKPNTMEIIQKIWQFRKETGANICFTLDAGANVHVLFPQSEKEQILGFIKADLAPFCQNGRYICDGSE